MRIADTFRTAGYLALGALPLCYLEVPGIPPFTRAVALFAAAGAFAAAQVLGAAATPVPSAARRAGLWILTWLGWQALSASWAAPGMAWAAAWPVLTGAAALAVAAGIAADPGQRRGLILCLSGWGLALALFAFNILASDLLETWIHGFRITGLAEDHLPFGNRNSAALLIAALLPPALLAIPAGFRRNPLRGGLALGAALALAWLLRATDALGALIGLAGGGLIAAGILRSHSLAPWTRRILAVGTLAAACLAAPTIRTFWTGDSLLTTTPGIRALVWESAVNAWRSTPWLGVGAGSFGLRFPEFQADLYPLSCFVTPLVPHAYNLPLQTLCETGPVGLLILMTALWTLFGAWIQGSTMASASMWTAVALLVQSLGGDALLDPLGLACFAVAAGWGLAGAGAPATVRPRHFLPGLVAPLFLVAACAEGIQVLAFAVAHRNAETSLETAEAAYAGASQVGIPSTLGLDARFQRGYCLLSLDRPGEALQVYEELMARGGPYGNARRAAARAALASGQPGRGIAWLKAQAACNPLDLETLRLLAAAAPGDPDLPALEAACVEAALTAPAGHAALEPVAAWRCSRGDWEAGWTLFRHALEADPERPDLRENTVSAGVRAGRPSEALALARTWKSEDLGTLLRGLDELVAGTPGHPEPLGTRALLRLAAGDGPAARADLASIPASPATARWREPLARLIGTP